MLSWLSAARVPCPTIPVTFFDSEANQTLSAGGTARQAGDEGWSVRWRPRAAGAVRRWSPLSASLLIVVSLARK